MLENIIDSVLDFNIVDKVTETGEVIGNAVTDSVWEMLGPVFDALRTYLSVMMMNIAEATIFALLEFTNSLFFSYKGITGPFILLNGMIGGVAAIVLTIIAVKRGTDSMTNMATGGEHTPLLKIFADVVKSGCMSILIPWFVALAGAALPIIMQLILGSSLYIKNERWWMAFLTEDEKKIIDGGWGEWLISNLNPGWWVLDFFLFLMIIIGSICYILNFCKFQVEIMYMDCIGILAAVDSATEEKQFYKTWLDSFKALLIVQVSNVVFYAFMMNRFLELIYSTDKVGSVNSVLAIGAAVCLIKGTIFTNKYKNGGMASGGFSAVTNAARTAVFMMPR